MINISVDVSEAKEIMSSIAKEGRERTDVLIHWLKQTMRTTIEGLLKAEMTVVLDRQPYERSGQEGVNYRNGSRERTLSLGTLGRLQLRVPRDRAGKYQSQFLPFRNMNRNWRTYTLTSQKHFYTLKAA